MRHLALQIQIHSSIRCGRVACCARVKTRRDSRAMTRGYLYQPRRNSRAASRYYTFKPTTLSQVIDHSIARQLMDTPSTQVSVSVSHSCRRTNKAVAKFATTVLLFLISYHDAMTLSICIVHYNARIVHLDIRCGFLSAFALSCPAPLTEPSSQPVTYGYRPVTQVVTV